MMNFTYAKDSSSFIDIGSVTVGEITTRYNVFAIVWSKYNQLKVSPSTLNLLQAAGSTATLAVTSNVDWSASSDQSWLSVTPSSGSGNGTIVVTAIANTTASARNAVVTVAAQGASSQIVTVVQAGVAPLLSISNATLNVEADEGSTGSFSIYSNTSWSLATDQSWIKVSQTSGNGNKSITVTVEANPLFTERTATIIASATGVETKTVVVTQKAATRKLTVSASALQIASDAGSKAVFTITSNLDWIIVSDQAWLTIHPDSGSGNSTVTVTAAKNETSTKRTAQLTVSAVGINPHTITVTQIAEEAFFSVSAEVLSIGAANGSKATFEVESNISWVATSSQSWLSLDYSSGAGNQTVTLTAGENKVPQKRTATITVSATGFDPKTITVTQVAGDATLLVSPSALEIGASEGSTGTFYIYSNTAWELSCDQSWLDFNVKITDPSDSASSWYNGNAMVTLSAGVNNTSAARVSTVTVSATGVVSQTVTVTQPTTVGIEENKMNGVILFPNPFAEGFYVKTSNEETTVSLFSLNGRLLFSVPVSGNTFIPASTLRQGIYFVELKTAGNVSRLKVVKQ